MTRLFAVSVLVLVAACTSGKAPAQAYRDFAAAVSRAPYDPAAAGEAWDLLSNDTREELTRAARVEAEAERRKPPKDGRELIGSQSALLARKVTGTDVAETNGERAVVVVTDDGGGRQRVTLVREGGRWRVHLADELRRAAAPR